MVAELDAIVARHCRSDSLARFAFVGDRSVGVLERALIGHRARLNSRAWASGRLSPSGVAAALRACDLLRAAVSRRRDDPAHVGHGGARERVPIVTTDGALTEAVWRDTRRNRAGSERSAHPDGCPVRQFIEQPPIVSALGRARPCGSTRTRFSIERTVEKLRAIVPWRPLPADGRRDPVGAPRGRLPRRSDARDRAKVLFKLQAEFRALGHRCETLFDREIGGSRVRQIRQLVSPGWQQGDRSLDWSARRTTSSTPPAPKGLWLGVLKKFGGYRAARCTCVVPTASSISTTAGCSTITTPGCISKPWTRRIWYPASRLSQVAAAARLADRMILLNECDREFVLARGWQTSRRVDVVPHGVSQEFLDNDPGPGAPRGSGLLFCGSWDHVKGITYLSRRSIELHDTANDLRLSVLGPGVPESTVLQAFPERLRHVRDRPRARARGQVMEMYRRHDLLIWPSTYEGFGLVILEAMSQRLPVVTTPVGCARSIVRDGQTGRLVPIA